LRLENKKLKAEVAELKETAEYYYQQGVYQVSLEKYDEAKDDFGTVISMFPTSPLVVHAKEQMNNIAKVIAKRETEQKIAEAKEKQKQDEIERLQRIADAKERKRQEQIERLQGTPMDYATFYAKINGGGVQAGKRYRLYACIDGNLFITNRDGSGTQFTDGVKDIDEDNMPQVEAFLAKGKRSEQHTIVVSLEWDGKVHIHRIE
jgi:hypothetical protein